MLVRVLGLLLFVSVVGCYASHDRPVPPLCGRRIQVDTTDAVDLLLLVDDSSSMAQEQDLLRAQIPRMIEVLAGGDRDGDGVADFVSPVRSLHVGVISSDLGAGDVPPGEIVPSCDPGVGDDGILLSTSADPRCDPEYPSAIFEFERETGDAAEFARVVGCVANLGTGGCGFEQQLEAVLKALSPARRTAWVAPDYVPPTFAFGTGHGDGANAGFLREGSVLSIVTLSDEEDCSLPDQRLFHPSDPEYLGNPLNLRCHRFLDQLYPISRYVEGLLALREDPSLLVWAPIVGLPPDLVGAPWDVVLADRRLTYVEDTSMDPPQRILPSCETAVGTAYPPRRFVEVARELELRGAVVTMESICQLEYRAAVDRILARVEEASRGSCLPVALPTDEERRVRCEMIQMLAPEGTPGRAASCAELGLAPGGVTEHYGRRRHVCRVPQLEPPAEPDVPPEGPGFYYDDESRAAREICRDVGGRRVAVVGLRERGELRLRCEQDDEGALEASCSRDEGCGPAPSGRPLICDALQDRCLAACVTDADCAEAGLLSYRCERGRTGDVAESLDLPLDGLDPSAPYGRCLNPRCG